MNRACPLVSQSVNPESTTNNNIQLYERELEKNALFFVLSLTRLLSSFFSWCDLPVLLLFSITSTFLVATEYFFFSSNTFFWCICGKCSSWEVMSYYKMRGVDNNFWFVSKYKIYYIKMLDGTRKNINYCMHTPHHCNMSIKTKD